MKSFYRMGALAVVGVLCFYSWGCGSTSSTTSSSSSSIDKSIMPSNSLISQAAGSNIASSSESEGLSRRIKNILGDSLMKAAFAQATSTTMTRQEKDAALAKIFAATTLEGCFDLPRTDPARNRASVDGFGPSGTYSNHPDGAPASGELLSGDTGIWNESSSVAGSNNTVATIAAQQDKILGDIETRVDMAMFAQAAAICLGRVNGLITADTPAQGEQVDLTAAMTAAMESQGITGVVGPSSIILKRLTNTSDGKSRYELSLEGTMPITKPGGGSGTIKTRAVLRNIALDSEGTLRRGNATFTTEFGFSGGLLNGGNCPAEGGSTEVNTVTYEQAPGSLKVESKSANFCGQLLSNNSSAFNPVSSTTGHIDPSLRFVPSTRPNGWADNFNSIRSDVDPKTGGGTFASCWQAGAGDTNARCTNLTLSETGGLNNAAGGCGHFGYGPSVTDATEPGIDRMICNWNGPNNSHTGVTFVQRQCVTFNSTTGKYDSIPVDNPDTSKNLRISYAPSNSCSGTFTYQDNDTSKTATLDNALGAARTHNLVPIASMNFTMPSAPDITGVLASSQSDEL